MVFGVFVISKIKIDGFLVQLVGNIVSHQGALRLGHIVRGQSQCRLGNGNKGRGADQVNGPGGAARHIARLQRVGDGVNYELHDIEDQQREDTLDDIEKDRQDGPPAAGFPHKEKGAINAQGIFDLGFERGCRHEVSVGENATFLWGYRRPSLVGERVLYAIFPEGWHYFFLLKNFVKIPMSTLLKYGTLPES